MNTNIDQRKYLFGQKNKEFWKTIFKAKIFKTR